MRTFTNHNTGKTYPHFNKDFSGIGPTHVVIVMVEGEPELYALDHPGFAAGLIEYLSDEDFGGKVLGIYSRK